MYLILLLLLTVGMIEATELKDLSLEEKVGQLLMAHFNGPLANEDAKELLEKAHVGSIIYYKWANELSSPTQIKELSSSLQKMNAAYSSIPLLICTDQEGGRISRLKEGFPLFPSQEEIGQTGNFHLAYEVAKAMGKELLSVGITMNLAPVVDVAAKERNWMSDRLYSSDPKMVVAFAEQALQGYREVGIIPVLKHFPGHGHASDSHAGMAIVKKSLAELQEVELYPYYRLAQKVPAIMTGHLLIPALDEIFPATFSKSILQNWLREKLGFQGVIMSDSLVMKGLSRFAPSYEEAAILALQSGVDLICLGGKLLQEVGQEELTVREIINIHHAIIEAVKEGRISEKQLDGSVSRILALKKSR